MHWRPGWVKVGKRADLARESERFHEYHIWGQKAGMWLRGEAKDIRNAAAAGAEKPGFMDEGRNGVVRGRKKRYFEPERGLFLAKKREKYVT